MDAARFDELARNLANTSSRRRASRTLAALALGGALSVSLGDGTQAKKCGPCRKKKKGKCKKKLPDGTPCGGECNACLGGACGSKPDGTACGGECNQCLSGTCGNKPGGTACGGVCNQCEGGSCGNKPNDTACNGTGRCLTGACNPMPTCMPAFSIACFNSSQCCSGACPGIFPNTSCSQGNSGTPCYSGSDCVSGVCSGFRCQ
jgi:hypothetical protein